MSIQTKVKSWLLRKESSQSHDNIKKANKGK